MRLVDQEPCPMGPAELDRPRQVADVALHREDPVDDDEDAAAVLGGAAEHLLQLVHPVVAERSELRPGEAAAVEDRGVVAGVADHGVARLEDRADAPDVGLVAGRVDDRVLLAHPLRQLALELEVQWSGPVQQARSGDAGAERLEGVAGPLLDPLVAGQAQVVVGAEHDRLAPLHLDHRPRRRGQQPKVGEQVVLLRRFELLEPIVAASLLEYVGRGPGCLAHGWKV